MIELLEDQEETPVVTQGQTPAQVVLQVRAELGDRRTYIGGSDAAAALGMSKWKDRLTLYQEKVGLVAEEDLGGIDAVYWGTVLENIVAQEYMRRTGLVVRRVPKLLRHPKHPFMGAHLDRIILNSAGGLEVKTSGRDGEEWGEEGTDEVPTQYFIQVQHYMAVSAREFFNIALLAGGQRFRVYHVRRDEKFIEDMTAIEVEFWEHVEKREPPEPQSSDEANRRWPISREGEVQAGPETALAVANLALCKKTIADLKEAEEKLELAIKSAIGDNGDTLMAGTRKLCTWKTSKAYHVEAYDVKATRKLLLAKQK
jgi:putative phage-type endonuclease